MQNSKGSVEVTGLHEVIHRCRVGSRLLVPRPGPRVQCLRSSRILGLQLGVQKLSKELVVAIPGRVPSNRDDKEPRVHRLSQEVGAVLVTEERVRQFHVELIDNRGCVQELDHFCGLLIEHLFDEEISYYTLCSGKASDERGWILGVVLQ